MEKTEIQTKETYIEKELKKFNVTDAAINQMSEKYMPLVINGLEDKEGFEKVHQARMDVKEIRVNVEYKRKELNSDALSFQRAVNTEAKRITSLLKPIETHLQDEENKIEQEKQRIRLEKERLEKEKLDERITKLTECGMLFNGLIYYYQELSIDAGQIKQMEDNQFNAYADMVKEKYDKEQERLAEEEKKRQDELDRLEKLKQEQEAEAKRLEEEKAKLQAQQDRIDEEKRIADSQKKKVKMDKLHNIGMYFDGNQFYYEDINLHWTEIVTLSEDEFEKKVKIFSDLIIKKKKEAEKKRLQEIEAAKQQAIEEEKHKQEKERKKLARIEARKPHKKKLEDFAITLGNLPFPQIKSEEYGKIIEQVKTKIGTIIAFINNSIEEIEK